MANADQCVGAIPRYSSHDLDLSELMNRDRNDRIAVGPVFHAAVDTGEDQPVRCVRNALILKRTPMPHAIFIFVRSDPGGEHRYVDVDIAVPRDHPGSEDLANTCFAPLEEALISAAPIAARCCRWRTRSTIAGASGASRCTA